jgi:ribosomal protein RSM22 (predicted rRNA methylase)
MQLPAPLRAAIERQLEGTSLPDLRSASQRLTQRYRAETRDGRLHLDSEASVRAYLAVRMPATFAAVRLSFSMVGATLPDFAPASLLDLGSGPGTVLWAAQDLWGSIEQANMVEASQVARKTGALLAESLPGSVKIKWSDGDISAKVGFPAADLVTLSYVLDELETAQAEGLIERLWSAANQLLVIVEPGTPAGWRRIVAARRQLIALGASLAAPCPHDLACPLSPPDWCHFSQRVARSRLHRLTKDGEAPFEDEKFAFVAASRLPIAARLARVLAPPHHNKAGIDIKLCEPSGACCTMQLAKRRPDLYRAAKRLDWGDAFDR